MSKKKTPPKPKNIPKIRKKEAFEAFIDILRGNAIAHWVQIADAVGVDKDTITEWKKHPLAQKAIRDGIETALEGMARAGKSDWRMWESKLKMLGVSPVEKTDITSEGKPLNIGVVSYAKAKEVKKVKEAKVDGK